MAGEKETVGIIGVGRMGLPMLRHLRTQGHDVWARDLDDKQRKVLERAKDELRDLFGKSPTRSKAS